jgi:hypothetical protein
VGVAPVGVALVVAVILGVVGHIVIVQGPQIFARGLSRLRRRLRRRLAWCSREFAGVSHNFLPSQPKLWPACAPEHVPAIRRQCSNRLACRVHPIAKSPRTQRGPQRERGLASRQRGTAAPTLRNLR